VATAKRAAKPKAKPKPKLASFDDALAQAIEHARSGDHAAVLDVLVAAWPLAPSADLDAMINAATVLAKPAVAAIRGKTKAIRQAWDALAARREPRDVGLLLESLADVSSADGALRLATVAEWRPDPRIENAVVGLLETVPYRATSTRKFWTALWPFVHAIRNPALLPRLEACDASIAKNVAVTMGDWLRLQLRKALTELRPILEKPAEPMARRTAELIADLATELARAAGGDTRQGELEHLLAAIYAAPADDGPRLVYADALLERGDPRGELIALQCRGELDREQRKREKELLEAHGKAWLGDLAPIVMGGYRFERGFLAACRIDNEKLDHVRAVVGNPAWSTVEELRGSALIALHPVMRSLRVLQFDSANARYREKIEQAWRDLLLGPERPIEVLSYDGFDIERQWIENVDAPGGRWVRRIGAEELAALMSCAALPKLRELEIRESDDAYLAQLWDAPVVKRLATLGFVIGTHGGFSLLPFARALREAPVATIHFTLRPDYHSTIARFDRGDAGYERLAMEIGPSSLTNWSETIASEAIQFLQAAPPSLREVRIATRRHFEAPARERVEEAARRLPQLSVCEIE
jgi:uncharacterized protein (TIGR02996 family)